jgi:hypothetical protein
VQIATVGVFLDRKEAERKWARGEEVWGAYWGEILGRARIPFRWLEKEGDVRDSPPDILVVALAGEESWESLWCYAEAGGELIVHGKVTAGISSRLGVLQEIWLDTAYSRLPWMEDFPPLRCFDVSLWKMNTKPAHVENRGELLLHPQADGETGVLQRFAVGKGFMTRWAVDIPATIVGLQQGRKPVVEDGSPAPDGTGNLDEGILKADDGFSLDWTWDRRQTETGQPYFFFPYGDGWREAWIRELLRRVLARGWTLPFMDAWPAGIRGVAMISLDSDLNLDASAETTLSLLGERGIRATWCMMEPGYSPAIYDLVKGAGHELAFHFNAYERDGGAWSEAEFARQLHWLKEAAKLEQVISNKNHYTRWEGWGELFRWCETFGIRSDQSRGPSKMGNIGFLFGTCQPYFPIARSDEKNRRYDVVEIGFLTQDMNLGRWADDSMVEPFLHEVGQRRGVAHFLFHQIHLHREEPVRKGLDKLVTLARQRGFAFWTGREIAEWERLCRGVKVTGWRSDGPVVENPADCDDAVVLVPLFGGQGSVEGETVVRYGFRCRKWVI